MMKYLVVVTFELYFAIFGIPKTIPAGWWVNSFLFYFIECGNP
jgi:hypothetical protein